MRWRHCGFFVEIVGVLLVELLLWEESRCGMSGSLFNDLGGNLWFCYGFLSLMLLFSHNCMITPHLVHMVIVSLL